MSQASHRIRLICKIETSVSSPKTHTALNVRSRCFNGKRHSMLWILIKITIALTTPTPRHGQKPQLTAPSSRTLALRTRVFTRGHTAVIRLKDSESRLEAIVSNLVKWIASEPRERLRSIGALRTTPCSITHRRTALIQASVNSHLKVTILSARTRQTWMTRLTSVRSEFLSNMIGVVPLRSSHSRLLVTKIRPGNVKISLSRNGTLLLIEPLKKARMKRRTSLLVVQWWPAVTFALASIAVSSIITTRLLITRRMDSKRQTSTSSRATMSSSGHLCSIECWGSVWLYVASPWSQCHSFLSSSGSP